MPQYSIASNGHIWHVMKDGRFFCMATSQKMAESVCASMGSSATPKVNEFRAWHVAIGSASLPQQRAT